jgi:CheY-like chemotaxis protein
VPLVTGDEAQLAQVFLTLLLLAADAIDEGHVEGSEIRVTARRGDDDKVEVDITSRASERPRAAPEMSPVEFLGGPDVEPAGFGLAVCRRVVEGYGGEISTQRDDVGRPSFRVSLAVSRRASRAPSASVREPSGDGNAKGAARAARVLVVDDEPRIGSAIARILGRSHSVTPVYTAMDALARLERGEEYDVILCDLSMPTMSGTDFYRSLETHAPRMMARVVFMTGGPFSTRGAELLGAVSNPRLEKPFSPEALRAVVDEVASSR